VFELRIRRATLKTLIGAAAGSILGIIGAYLIGSLISHQHSDALREETKTFLTLALTFFMAYVGLMVGAAKGDYLDLSALGGIFSDKVARRACWTFFLPRPSRVVRCTSTSSSGRQY
jgi:uncharacterized protein YacL